MFQTAGEGEYFYSLPGFVDSCSADPLVQGAVIFEDVSLDAPNAAAAMGRIYGVDVNAKPANIVNMPYIVGTTFGLTRQAETALVVNSPDAPNPKRMTVAVKPPVSSVGSFAKTPKPAQERVRKDVEDMVEEEALNARKVDLLNGAVNIFSMRASSAGRAGEEVTLDELERATINGVRGTYLETLNYVAEEANIEDGIVIVACDRSVYEGPNKGFRMMAREIVKNIGLELDLKKPGAVVFVEGSSQDALEEEITRAIDRAPDKRVRRVVTILNAEHRLTWNADKVFSEDLEGSIQRTPEDIAANRPGAVLMSVDLTELHKEWTPYKSTITLRGLYGIAINLGYGQLERAAIMYHLIDKDAPSIPEIMNMLAERIIRLIPRIAKVPIGDMPKAYQAAKQALVSL